jgi:hypothetical protein
LPLLVYGMGVGLATAQLTGVVLADVPVERGGQASGTASTMRQLGSALGIAILGAVLFSTLSTEMTSNLAREGFPQEVAAPIVEVTVQSAGAVLPQWSVNRETAAQGFAGREALTSASKKAAFAGAIFLLFGLIASLRLKNVVPEPVKASAEKTAPRKSRKKRK